MPTIPTGKLEAELRKRYLRFVSGLSMDSKNLQERLAAFERDSLELIESMGGRTAALGALAGFPAPKSLDLSPWQGTIYNEMQTTAIRAGIIAGSSSKEAAQAMFRAGMDKSYRRLERLARTETTNAYWKNAFGSIADLPLLVMLWGSEDGPRTCAWCRERDGMVISGSEVRDHPNGRCTPIPTLRSQVQYRGSVDRDGSIFFDPEWEKKKPIAPDASMTMQATEMREIDWQPADARSLPRSPMLDDEMGELAAEYYTSGYYADINGYMRTGAMPSGERLTMTLDPLTSDEMPDIVDTLTAITSSATDKDLVLHRMLGEVDFLGDRTDVNALVGRSFKDKGFVSTSYNLENSIQSVDVKYQMEILAPKGTRGSLMDNDEEAEFLLAPGSTFTILDAVVDKFGVTVLRVALTQN